MFVSRYLTFHGGFRLSFDQFLKLKCEAIHKTIQFVSNCPLRYFAKSAYLASIFKRLGEDISLPAGFEACDEEAQLPPTIVDHPQRRHSSIQVPYSFYANDQQERLTFQ